MLSLDNKDPSYCYLSFLFFFFPNLSTAAIGDIPMTMTPVNPLNIYTGPDSLQDYYDPEKQPLLPLVEIPDGLNPFRGML